MNGAARAYGAWRIGARSENSEFDPSILPIRATTTQSAPFDRIENLIIAPVNSPFQPARYKRSLESIRDSRRTIRAARHKASLIGRPIEQILCYKETSGRKNIARKRRTRRTRDVDRKRYY